MSGFVYLVGAGPGDPELLTLKAHRLLTEVADIVVYDRLIPEGVLDVIPEGVERLYAGKSCRKHHMTQEEINAVLVAEAKKGQTVVRLKGGDPFIFGRGGEELQALVAAGIDFEVVPGVNAADGCAAALGIPLTHRGVARGVRFITGHMQQGQDMQLDYQGLAQDDTTLVIYMGLAHLADITAGLMAHGMDKNMPVVVIQEGTTDQQQVVSGCVLDIAEKVEASGLKPPSLVIVGRVVTAIR